MIHSAHRGYPKTSIVSEILLLCCVCKNINYSLTKMDMLDLKHLSNNDGCFYDEERLKQPSSGVLRKRYSENMQQIYRKTPMSKFDFNKVAK